MPFALVRGKNDGDWALVCTCTVDNPCPQWGVWRGTGLEHKDYKMPWNKGAFWGATKLPVFTLLRFVEKHRLASDPAPADILLALFPEKKRLLEKEFDKISREALLDAVPRKETDDDD